MNMQQQAEIIRRAEMDRDAFVAAQISRLFRFIAAAFTRKGNAKHA
ncbi:hypothetical protein [Falsirhodobacter deserti]|nr:hypothetical protein [Falsirhodobacter deserti]